MKTKHLFLIAFAALLLFFQGSCDKDDGCPVYELPEATQTGANTIGCKVNGQVCVPKSGGLFSPITKRMCYDENTGKLILTVYFIPIDKDLECGLYDLSLKLISDSIFDAGLIDSSNYSAMVDITPQYQPSTMYSYRSYFPDLTAKVEITKLDKANRIISGTFSFEGYEVLSINGDEYEFGEKAYVTDGRFDFTYNEDGTCVEGYSN
jgi:hypothetical protein